MARVHNFFPGPGALPLNVIKEVQAELEDFAGIGTSILECSHRTPQYEEVHNRATGLVRELLKMPENYHVMWLQGGASLQFTMLPMNRLGDGKTADYIDTGFWSTRAITEAKIVGDIRIAAGSKEDGYTYVPRDFEVNPEAQYLHYTSNNTIFGTQFFEPPNSGDVPLVADMSSDVLWRFFDVTKYGMIYAGAHKNLGPSGATLVIMRDDFLCKCKPGLPTLLCYDTHVKNNSMFNTPPTFTIYFISKVLQQIKDKGGLDAMEAKNRKKAELLYNFIDNSGGFFNCPIKVEDRSVMNAVFEMQTEELEATFIQEAIENGFIGLKNLPMRGHLRCSIYNSTEVESVVDLIDFMKDFMARKG